MSNEYEFSLPPRRSRVERVENLDGSIFIPTPPEITEDWLEDLTEEFGLEEYEVTLESEDWLVQRNEGESLPISSADYSLEDMPGPHGACKLKGRFWNASLTSTPQYVEGWKSPVIAILDAKLVRDQNQTPIPREPRHLVLVRLDRVATGLTLTPYKGALPPAA